MSIFTFSHSLSSSLSHAQDEAQSVIQRCLQRWKSVPPAVPADASEAERLHDLQHFLAEVFTGCWIDMRQRDRELYRLLIRCTELDVVARRRFDCFDLMCRLLGEGAARQHLRQIDTWLMAPR